MAKRKKLKPFRAVDAVKAAAREKLGTPPPTRRVPDAKKERRDKQAPQRGEIRMSSAQFTPLAPVGMQSEEPWA